MSGAMQGASQVMGSLHQGMMQLAQGIAQQRMMSRLQPLQANGEHGSAEFLTLQQRIDAGLIWDREANPNQLPGIPILGSTGGETWWRGTTFWGKRKIISQIDGSFYEVYGGDRHIVTIAPNGSGKSSSVVIPNLVLNPAPAIVNDPKEAEIFRATGSYRQQVLGHKVHLIDPFGESGVPAALQASFNPVDVVRMSKAPEAYSLLMSHAIVPDRANESNSYFPDSARMLFQASVLHVAFYPRFSADQRHLGTVQTILSETGPTRRMYLADMAASGNRIVAMEGQKALNRATGRDGDNDDIANTVLSKMGFLNSPQVLSTMTRSTFDFRKFRTELHTLYVCLPAGLRESFGGWQRLIYLSAMVALESLGNAKPHEYAVRFMLDEFATSLGHFKELSTYFPVGRSYGMRFWLFLQDIGQLIALYGKEGAGTFLEQAGVVQAFGGNSDETAKYLSEKLGKRTIVQLSQNRSTVWGQGGPSAGMNEALMGQPLMTPDEVERMKPGEQLLFYKGAGAARATMLNGPQHMPWLEQWKSIPLRRDNHPVDTPRALPSPGPSLAPTIPQRVAEPARLTLPKRKIRCPSCRGVIPVPTDRGKLKVTCTPPTGCGHVFHWSPV